MITLRNKQEEEEEEEEEFRQTIRMEQGAPHASEEDKSP